mmetsp:Transcript_12577/g.16943  ORF Transcript_12577/g.16943 Transcript_12577/m.16943 type:complete len:153 (-) Transcript_12577:84-542(-)
MADVVEQLEEVMLADDVQAAIDEFIRERLPLFESMGEDLLSRPGAEGEDQQLEWHRAYQEYTALMEERVLQAYLAQEPQLDREALHAALARLAEVPAEGEAVEVAARVHARFLLSVFEYDSFLGMMKEQVRCRRAGAAFGLFARRPQLPEGA